MIGVNMTQIFTWNKIINQDICSYNPNKGNNATDNVNLSNNLSPLTEFFLNSFINLIEEKNLIINFPDPYLRPIPLLSYIYAKKYEKSVLVVTLENGISYNKINKETINKNYQLLNPETTYLFYQVPIVYLVKNHEDFYNLNLEKYLPRATIDFKKNFDRTIEELLNNEGPKIIIETDKNFEKIENSFEKILNNPNIIYHSSKINLGLLIIENADRFLYSKKKCENFISWVKNNLNDNINILLHFSNPKFKFTNLIKEELNFLIIPFNQSILNNNKSLISHSEKYFESKNNTELKILSKYNLDKPYNYKNDANLSIFNPLIKSGGIDYFFNLAKENIENIDVNSIFNKHFFYKSLEILYSLYNLTINPSFLKINIHINKQWYYLSIPEFINIFLDNLNRENKFNRYRLNEYLISLNNIYLELSRCKRFNDDLSYNRESKDYKILELVEKLVKNKENVIIGTYNRTEPKILENQIINLKNLSIDNISIKYMGNLNKDKDSEKANKILVLPGLIPEVFISEIYKPYKKIIILAYEGKNFKLIKTQINQIKNYQNEEEQIAMDNIEEIYKFLKINTNDNFFNNFKSRNKDILNPKTIERKDVLQNTNVQNIDSFKELLDKDLKLFMSNWKESKNNLYNIISNNENIKYETISVKLKNFENNQIVEKSLPTTKTFLSFRDLDNIEGAAEIKPSELKVGHYVIIINNNEKKTLLELVTEIYNYNLELNTSIIEYWKEKFLEYIEFKELSYKQLYEEYINIGGTKNYQTILKWGKGEVIGPQKEEDLLYIGKLIKNPHIINNYKEMFYQINLVRLSHRKIGRQLKKMIKTILSDENLNIDNLTLEEDIIYQNIKNGIFEVLEINH